MMRGKIKNVSRQKAIVIQPALVVARRQYIPSQNSAAKVMGTIHVNSSCLNISSIVTEIITAPSTTMPPVIRPRRRHSRSPACGLKYGT